MGAFPSLLAFSNLLSNSPKPASLPPCPPPLALGAPFILLGPYLTEMSVLLALPLPLESWPALRAVERGGGRGEEEEEGGGETRPRSAHSRVKSESLCRVEIFLPPEASCFSLALRSCSRSDSCEFSPLCVCVCLSVFVVRSTPPPLSLLAVRMLSRGTQDRRTLAKMHWQKCSYLTSNTYLTTIVHP